MQIALCSRFAAGGFIDLPSIKQRPIKKLLRIMKLTAILLTIACLTAGAIGNTQGITLSLKNAPLEKAFSAIEKQSGYYFTYTKELLHGTANVNIEVKNKDVKEVLDLCLKGQPVTYEILGNSIIIKKEKPQSFVVPNGVDVMPPIDVRGRVVNEKGEPVAGVTVTVRGTNKSTATNDNGEFIIKEVNANDKLIFTSINMESFEINLEGKTDLNINLKTKVTTLGSVDVKINTGYQTLNKERFIGSTFIIDSALFNRTITTDLISRLEGIAPGVLFLQKSTGTPVIQIRGASTLGIAKTPGTPLIVVDNFPYYDDLNNINPNDVESITILKDAAAASVWGAKAGNGVIVITTKKGKYNQPFHLSLGTSFRVQEKPDLLYYPQMTSSDFIDVEQFLFGKGFYDGDLSNTNRWPVISPVVEILAQQRAGKISTADATAQIDALRSLDTRNDYEKYVYRPSISRQDYLNFSGGTNLIKYGLSLGYDRSQSDTKNAGHTTRYTINSTTSFKPFKILEFTIGVGYSQNESKLGNTVAYPIQPGGGKNQMYPYAQLADAVGNPLPVLRNFRMSFVDTVAVGKLLDWHYRPLDELLFSDSRIKNQAVRVNAGANLKFTSWLEGNVAFGYTQQNSATRGYSSTQTYFVRDLVNRYTQINGASIITPIPLGGILNVSNSEARTYNIRGQLNFNKKWAGKHNLTAMLAGEAGENKGSANTNRFYGYDNDVLSYATTIDYNTLYPQFVGGAARIPNGDNYAEGIVTRTVDFLSNISYTYLDRYTLYASARKDGANIFGVNTNNKWKPLWSAGVSWDISKEGFYRIAWLPSLRLRASYGYTGNANNTLSSLTTLRASASGNSPYTQLPMSIVLNPPNPELRWEKVGMVNIGIDFAAFKNRISGSIEWYKKKSQDVIANAPIDPTTGVNSVTLNYANLKGKGFEIILNTKNIYSQSFQWNTSINFSYNKAIVTKYNGSFVQTPVAGYGAIGAGRNVYGLYSYKWMGLDPTTGDPQGWLNKGISKDYASIFVDSFQNQVYHGSGVPLYYGNILNSFSFKGFTVSVNITYKFAYYFRKSAISYSSLFNGWSGHLEYNMRWQNPGDEVWTSVPSMTYPADNYRDQFYAGSEINVERGDNIRLENIRLGFPAWENKKSTSFPIKSIQLSFIPANLNLFIWKASKSGLDPDYSGFSYQIPPAKVWAVALNVNFK